MDDLALQYIDRGGIRQGYGSDMNISVVIVTNRDLGSNI